MSAKKKDIKIMCGSCLNDFLSTEITIVSLPIKPDGTGAQFCKQLCPKCVNDPYYKDRAVKEEPYRKFN
jgi:hypothetical protein